MSLKEKAHLVSFSTTIYDKGYPDYELRQTRLNKSAKNFGITNVISYNRQLLLKTSFYQQHKYILDHKKGAGYWLWKPYIISEYLRAIPWGHFLIYCDNSMYFINDPEILLNLCVENNGFGLYIEGKDSSIGKFTRREVFDKMNMNFTTYEHYPVTMSSLIILQKNERVWSFINDFLNYCLQPDLLMDTDYVQGLSNSTIFKEHKHDMSILSLLRIKHSIPGYRVPTQFGNHLMMEKFWTENDVLVTSRSKDETFYNSPYGTILTWDKMGLNCKRPFLHYLQPMRVLAVLRSILNKP